MFFRCKKDKYSCIKECKHVSSVPEQVSIFSNILIIKLFTQKCLPPVSNGWHFFTCLFNSLELWVTFGAVGVMLYQWSDPFMFIKMWHLSAHYDFIIFYDVKWRVKYIFQGIHLTQWWCFYCEYQSVSRNHFIQVSFSYESSNWLCNNVITNNWNRIIG